MSTVLIFWTLSVVYPICLSFWTSQSKPLASSPRSLESHHNSYWFCALSTCLRHPIDLPVCVSLSVSGINVRILVPKCFKDVSTGYQAELLLKPRSKQFISSCLCILKTKQNSHLAEHHRFIPTLISSCRSFYLESKNQYKLQSWARQSPPARPSPLSLRGASRLCCFHSVVQAALTRVLGKPVR